MIPWFTQGVMGSCDRIRLFDGMDYPELESIGLWDDSSEARERCKVMDCLGPYVDVLFERIGFVR